MELSKSGSHHERATESPRVAPTHDLGPLLLILLFGEGFPLELSGPLCRFVSPAGWS
jgi:hypothetical protein